MHELKSISDMRFKVNGLVGLLKKLTVKKAENFVNISFLPDEVLLHCPAGKKVDSLVYIVVLSE